VFAVGVSGAPFHLRPSQDSLRLPTLLDVSEPIRVKTPEHEESAASRAKRDADETLSKVKKVDIPGMLRRDAAILVDEFLPGVQFRTDILLLSLAFVTGSALWFCIFVRHIYENDRKEDLSRWGEEGGKDDAAFAVHTGCVENDLKPDFVIVFHHPQHPHKDGESPATFRELHRTLIADVSTWRVIAEHDPGGKELGGVCVRSAPSFDAPKVGTKAHGKLLRGFEEDGWVALEGEVGYVSILDEAPSSRGPTSTQEQPALELVGANASEAFARTKMLMKAIQDWEEAKSPLQHLRRLSHSDGESSGGRLDMKPPSKNEVRQIFLQDLYTQLPLLGFDAAIFSSIDDDELYVCISLENQEALDAYLLRNNTRLQVRKDIVSRLGISQPPDEIASSPPLLRYDPRIVQNLHKAEVLPEDEARQLYRTHHGRDEHGCIASGKERFRLLYKELCSQLDLDAAVAEGLIVDWYPSHSYLWLSKLTRTWASFGRLHDFSFVQPVPMIHDYFGARVAFIFAWNGLYCKALFALTVLSIIVEVCAYILKQHFDAETVHKRIVLSFSIVTIIWSRMTANLWDREHQYFVKAWEMDPFAVDQVIRPSFQGEKQPSPADLNILEKQYPPGQAAIRRFCTTLVTLISCGLVGICIVIWTNIFEGKMNLFASVCLAAMIFVFQILYDIMVPLLTNWENHKYQSTYYDSYLWKQFMFQSVNRYAAFFYLAIKQRYTAVGCPERGCLRLLQEQLVSTFLILTLTGIAQVIAASLLVRVKIMCEDCWLRRSRQEDSENEKGEISKRSFVELQSKFAEGRMQAQIQHMLQLVLSLGFVLLFGAVAPIIVPFCLAVFTVQLRGTAFLMLNYTKRAVPRHQFGIGQWRSIISFLMQASVIFSGFLIAVYGDTFAGAPLLAKVAGVFLYILGMRAIWALVDKVCPPNCRDLETLQARRDRVLHVIMQQAEGFTGAKKPGARSPRAGQRSPGAGQEPPHGVVAHLAEEVKHRSWEKVPHCENAAYLKR